MGTLLLLSYYVGFGGFTFQMSTKLRVKWPEEDSFSYEFARGHFFLDSGAASKALL